MTSFVLTTKKVTAVPGSRAAANVNALVTRSLRSARMKEIRLKNSSRMYDFGTSNELLSVH